MRRRAHTPCPRPLQKLGVHACASPLFGGRRPLGKTDDRLLEEGIWTAQHCQQTSGWWRGCRFQAELPLHMRAAEEASSSGFAIKGDAVRPRGGRPCRLLRSEDGRHCRLLRSEDGRSGASSASSPRGRWPSTTPPPRATAARRSIESSAGDHSGQPGWVSQKLCRRRRTPVTDQFPSCHVCTVTAEEQRVRLVGFC